MTKPKHRTVKVVGFADFWLSVATELGSARIRLNSEANSIHDFINRDSDARQYLQNAIKSSYKASKCQHLKSPLNLEALLDILGEAAFTLQGDHLDDLFDIELLEEIAWHISDRYQAELEAVIKDWSERYDVELGKSKTKHKYRSVSSIPNYKIRRANAQL